MTGGELLNENVEVYILLRTKTVAGKPVFAYVAVQGDRLAEFRDAFQNDHFNPADYGRILECGEGNEPPEDIKRYMEEEYGFDHESGLSATFVSADDAT